MSLLQTNNKKFKIPVVFIAGVIFLIGLTYFAKYVEDVSKDAIQLELPKVSDVKENGKSVSIKITKSKEVYLDSVKVSGAELEEKLKIQFDGQANPTIELQAEEGVPISSVVRIMDIANKNRYKVILSVPIK
jgi:biopolymer transport protein ExbD